jgi:hypothetical protein
MVRAGQLCADAVVDSAERGRARSQLQKVPAWKH